MTDDVAPEFISFINKEREEKKLPDCDDQMKEGEFLKPVQVDPQHTTELFQVAARRAAGIFTPTGPNEIVWMQGESELAIHLAGIQVKLAGGLIVVRLPVRCDQTGDGIVEIAFAVGTDKKPAGLYASTFRRPNGPPLIVDAWGEHLVAFAWQCLLGMTSSIAGAVGRDALGNSLVPAELTASEKGIQIVPMARFRFSGSTMQDTSQKSRGDE